MQEVRGEGDGATMDHMDLEKERGITITSAATQVDWQGHQINLIDTPGHVDFSAEVERSLRVLDCAVLVLSAVEGVQAQSEPLWDALEALGIPVIGFVNKIDRMGSDVAGVVAEVQRVFSKDAVLVNGVAEEGFDAAGLAALEAEQYGELVEKVAERDDGLLERYLELSLIHI